MMVDAPLNVPLTIEYKNIRCEDNFYNNSDKTNNII